MDDEHDRAMTGKFLTFGPNQTCNIFQIIDCLPRCLKCMWTLDFKLKKNWTRVGNVMFIQKEAYELYH